MSFEIKKTAGRLNCVLSGSQKTEISSSIPLSNLLESFYLISHSSDGKKYKKKRFRTRNLQSSFMSQVELFFTVRFQKILFGPFKIDLD